jgi:hypothetical protein
MDLYYLHIVGIKDCYSESILIEKDYIPNIHSILGQFPIENKMNLDNGYYLMVVNNNIQIYPLSGEYLTEHLWIKIMENNPHNINIVPYNLITNEICKIAFNKDREILKYIPKKFITQEMCNEACKYNIKLFEFVLDKFKTEELCIQVYCSEYDYLRKYVPKEMIIDEFLSKVNDRRKEIHGDKLLTCYVCSISLNSEFPLMRFE